MAVIDISRHHIGTFRKCCNCGKGKPVYKAFAVEDNQTRTRWTGRKPAATMWCETCWKDTETQTEQDRQQRDKEIADAIEALRKDRQ